MKENVAVALTMALTMLAVLTAAFAIAWRRMLHTPVLPGAWGFVMRMPSHITVLLEDR